jgi:hypothetical protein
MRRGPRAALTRRDAQLQRPHRRLRRESAAHLPAHAARLLAPTVVDSPRRCVRCACSLLVRLTRCAALGEVSALRWASAADDEAALAVGWRRVSARLLAARAFVAPTVAALQRGIAVWSIYGCRLLCSVSTTSVGSVATPTVRSPHLSLCVCSGRPEVAMSGVASLVRCATARGGDAETNQRNALVVGRAELERRRILPRRRARNDAAASVRRLTAGRCVAARNDRSRRRRWRQRRCRRWRRQRRQEQQQQERQRRRAHRRRASRRRLLRALVCKEFGRCVGAARRARAESVAAGPTSVSGRSGVVGADGGSERVVLARRPLTPLSRAAAAGACCSCCWASTDSTI